TISATRSNWTKPNHVWRISSLLECQLIDCFLPPSLFMDAARAKEHCYSALPIEAKRPPRSSGEVGTFDRLAFFAPPLVTTPSLCHSPLHSKNWPVARPDSGAARRTS